MPDLVGMLLGFSVKWTWTTSYFSTNHIIGTWSFVLEPIFQGPQSSSIK